MQVESLGWKDPLEEGMATHSSILAWRIPWTEEPGGLQSTGLQRVRHDWKNLACIFGGIQLIGIGTHFKSLLFDLNSYTVWAYVTELAIILLAPVTKPCILSRWNRYLHSLFCLFALSFFNLNLFVFNRRIIALWCCVGFCHTLTWISHRYSQVPSFLSLPPTC